MGLNYVAIYSKDLMFDDEEQAFQDGRIINCEFGTLTEARQFLQKKSKEERNTNFYHPHIYNKKTGNYTNVRV